MLFRMTAFAVLGAIALDAEPAGPSGFYIVSQFFSDDGPRFSYSVLEVKSEGPDTVIRDIRIAPANAYCSRPMVQAAEARVRDKSPADIAGPNPCAVPPSELRRAVGRFRQYQVVFETFSFGVVALCGQRSVVLELPNAERVDLEKIKSSEPAMAALWKLGPDVIATVFGLKNIFHDRSELDYLELQRTGEKLIDELISGRFDEGLAAAVHAFGDSGKSPTFRSLLSGYEGPFTAANAKAEQAPRLVNASRYRFEAFVAPQYPPLAKQANIQGNVELEITVAPSTGEVLSVSAVSGHRLLASSAIDAARRWRFEGNSLSSESVNVTIEYSLRCH